MRIKLLKRPFDSVFTKLIVVMLVSGTLLVIVIISVSWHGFRESQKTYQLYKNLEGSLLIFKSGKLHLMKKLFTLLPMNSNTFLCLFRTQVRY